MKIETIDKICIERGMKKLAISSFPTWANSSHDEGIEFKGGKLISFWANIGGVARDYTEPPSEFIKKTLEIIENETQQKETPKQLEKEQSLPALVEHIDAILPDFITPSLMQKWKNLPTTERILLFQRTPKDKIKEVEVGKDFNGKKVYASYVEGNYMFKEANAGFLFDWFLSDVVITVGTEGVGVTATLNAWFSDYQKYLTRPATGYQETNKKVTIELAKKGAITDAIKKGLSLFGFNSDVYSGEV